MESTKSQLEKANARLDDLQAQVNAKNMIERQLSIEKSQLEMSVDSSNKAVERMSQNVEELQWRIRNNFDLPVHVHGSLTLVLWWLEGVGGTNELQPNMRQGFLHLFARWLVARWSREGARA